MIDIASFVIHLDRAEGRLPNVANLLDRLGPAAEQLQAVDGTQISADEIARHIGGAFLPRYPFPLRRAEVATFLSHRRSWQRIVDRALPMALVIEDDATLGPGFEPALALALRHVTDGMLIRFPVKRRERFRQILAKDGGIRLGRPRTVALGMQTQLVTQGAARQLLAMTDRFDRPVDTFLQARWIHHTDVLSVLPSGVGEMSGRLGGSLIGEKVGLLDRLRRELRRPVFRLATAIRSRTCP